MVEPVHRLLHPVLRHDILVGGCELIEEVGNQGVDPGTGFLELSLLPGSDPGDDHPAVLPPVRRYIYVAMDPENVVPAGHEPEEDLRLAPRIDLRGQGRRNFSHKCSCCVLCKGK